MFGENEKSPVLNRGEGDTLPVREIFYTIQGEGTHSGRAAVFVRLGGCNLACFFCDTDFDIASSLWMGADELAETVVQRLESKRAEHGHYPMVVITGGEPLLYNLAPFLSRVKANLPGVIIQIETAGTTIGPDTVRVIHTWGIEVVCSPKTAKVHPEVARLVTAWKYVLRQGETGDDGLPCYSTQERGAPEVLYRANNGASVYVQPCDEQDDRINKRNLAAVASSSLKHGHRASVQLHKLMELE